MRPALPSSPVEIKHDSPPFLHVWRNPDRNSFFFRMMLLNGLFLFPPLPFSPPALPGRPARAGHAHYPGPGRPGSAHGFQKSGKRFSSGSRTPDDACPLGRIAPVRPGIPRFRLHFRRFHVLFPGEIHQRKRFLRPRASPSLETGSRPGFSGATGQWNAYLDGKHALCLRSGADWFFLRHCRNLHPAVPPDGSGCLCGGVHPSPHSPAPVHLRQLHAGRLRQLMGGQALAPRSSAWGSF